MNICTNCKHMRKGDAIDRRKAEPGYPAPAPRPRRGDGDFICGRLPIVPALVDPQTGFQAQPSGEDCRDLNPAGECQDFIPSARHFANEVVSVVIAATVLALLVLAAIPLFN